MEKSREAMLQDFEKPKVMADNASLEPDWLTKKNKNWDREETWWDRDHKGRSERNFSGSLVNIFYILLLLAELILWIKVRNRYDFKGNMEVGLKKNMKVCKLIVSQEVPRNTAGYK